MAPRLLWGKLTRGMPAVARNRFNIHFKAKKFINGKADLSSIKIYTSFVEAHRARTD